MILTYALFLQKLQKWFKDYLISDRNRMLTVFGLILLSELLQTLYFWSVVKSFFSPGYLLACFDTLLVLIWDFTVVGGVVYLHYTNYREVEETLTFQ